MNELKTTTAQPEPKLSEIIANIEEQQQQIKAISNEINARLYGSCIDESGVISNNNIDGYYSRLEAALGKNKEIIKILTGIVEFL